MEVDTTSFNVGGMTINVNDAIAIQFSASIALLYKYEDKDLMSTVLSAVKVT